MSERGIATHAASCAFYTFLSLFPMAALAASLMPCMGVSQAALLHLVDGFVPSNVTLALEQILTNVYRRVFPALPLSLLVLLWSSARAFSELLRGMAAMAGTDPAAGYLKRRLRAILLIMALLTTLWLSLAVLIFGARIALLLERILPQAARAFMLILRLRHPVIGVLLWLLFVFLYRSIPGQKYSFKEVRTGSALAAMTWMLFSALFSLYADRFLNISLYGSMATMVLTMLWLFYCQHILLTGAGFCAWRHSKKEAASLTAS